MWWSRAIRVSARLALVLALPLLLTACGFKPLYGELGRTGAAQADLSQIEIEPSRDRTGQRLRQILVQNLTPKGAPARPKYRLMIALAEGQDAWACAQITRSHV